MKDRFKFRGMNKGQWYYGGYFKHLPYTPYPVGSCKAPEKDYKHLIIQDGFSDWGLPREMSAFEVESETVGQCTGLKDKNGKLIYEGDIVKNFHVSSSMQGRVFIGYVVYDDTRCRFHIQEDKHCGYITFSNTDDIFEVIGNIYENPELLEVQNADNE